MSKHRNDSDINELKKHFDSVMDWINNLFDYTGKEVCGLEWGYYYDRFHEKAYDKKSVNQRVEDLMSDPYVHSKRGIFEFILGGEKEHQLLDIRVFDEVTKRSVYEMQTKIAKKENKSNCPLCKLGQGDNATRIWKLDDMDADHVTAWSKGGSNRH